MTSSRPSMPSVDFEDRLLPFQKDAVRFLRGRRNALLLLEQGLGKTVVAIRAANALGLKRLLVVCPAIARQMWSNMTTEWSVDPDIDLTVVSYDWMSRGHQLDEDFDLVIIDEGHYLKNARSKRTRAIYGAYKQPGVISRAKYVWVLSGTLTPNGVHELYPHLSALFPEAISWQGRPAFEWEFINRYCTTRPVPGTQRISVTGVKRDALPELKAHLRQIAMRRRKRDVLPELPPIRFEHFPMTPEDLHDRLDSLGETPDIQLRMAEAIDAIEAGEHLDAQSLSTIRRLTGQAKIIPAADYITELLPEAGKVVVFAHHRDVITGLENELANYRDLSVVTVHGGTDDRTRNLAIDEFQRGGAQVFIGQINAASTAITLTAASRVVFVEASWVPADNAQAAARCHRIGTVNPVLATFLSLSGSLDEAITGVLKRKTAALAQLWEET